MHVNKFGSKSSSADSAISLSLNVALVSTLVVAANPARKGLLIYNNSANSIYLKYGYSPVTSGNCTRILATFTHLEMTGPYIYTGPIYGIRNAGSGTCTVTELT